MNETQHPKVTFFGWPSNVGGADTKLVHLLLLLHKHASITVVPNEARHLTTGYWTRWLDNLGIRYCSFEQLTHEHGGYGVSLSNQYFFSGKICHRAKQLGLTIVWSSEMMWHHEGEIEAIRQGMVDKVLYVSEIQRQALSPGYGCLPSTLTGNYIEPKLFPFRQRRNDQFTIGRLSRPAVEKFPEDFPVFYESLEIPECIFRVMAWNSALAEKFKWHAFDSRWRLLEAEEETQVAFLHSLDLFIYPLGHTFTETWGRSTVEAMLTGCIPLVPPGHNFDQLIVDGETGFVCDDFKKYQSRAHELYFDYTMRCRVAKQCRDHMSDRSAFRQAGK
mgnify:CR=1 FL=1